MTVLWISLLVLGPTPDGAIVDGGMPAVPAEWGAQRTPVKAVPASVGGYSAGCLQGAVALPPSGRGYELLHLGRHRGFGHPSLVDFIRRLALEMQKRKLGRLLVGDMSQPRGGPTPTGHRSHQTGLDADLGFVFPQSVGRRLTTEQRESLMPPAVVDLTAGKLNELWHPRIGTLLELAASDPVVDRIFVNPVIKRELCSQAQPNSAWLRKLRPWWGHHDHFHVRLRCPAGDAECQTQEPLPPDDGCAKLAWWFSADARKTREKRTADAAAGPPPLPARCREVLDSRK
jgi:penicillin-insensitive murein DD-endopeptidase